MVEQLSLEFYVLMIFKTHHQHVHWLKLLMQGRSFDILRGWKFKIQMKFPRGFSFEGGEG